MGQSLYAAENLHEETKHYDQYDLGASLSLRDGPGDMLQANDEMLEYAEGAAQTAFEQVSIVQGIVDSLESKKVSSDAYMTSLENYRPILQQIFGNLGAMRMIPAVEDFTNQYAAEAAHQIATEGLMDYVQKIWGQIKEFFVTFFKKVSTYLRRMVKANLEMEDYERYLDPMMAKLRSKPNAAKPTSLKPFDSKLPLFLADEGMESVSVEYLLNNGTRKTTDLLKLMDTLGYNGLGNLNKPDGLPMLELKIKEFIATHKVIGGQSLDVLRNDTQAIYDIALSQLVDIFPHIVDDPRALPEKVYGSLQDAFTRAEMGEGFIVRSLQPLSSGRDSLPKNANIFLGTNTKGGDVIVEGHLEGQSHVRNMVEPPQTFSNIQMLYDFYKNAIKKIKVEQADKNLDKLNDHLVKLITLVQKELVPIVQESAAVRISSANKKSFGPFILAGSNGDSQVACDLITNALTAVFGDGAKDSNFHSAHDVQDGFMELVRTPVTNSPRWMDMMTKLYNTLEARLELPAFGVSMQTLWNEIACQMTSADSGGRSSVMSVEDLVDAKELLQGLNRALVNFFTRLQTILRFLMTNVYAVYTELRYEWIRYIYMSAQRYRLT